MVRMRMVRAAATYDPADSGKGIPIVFTAATGGVKADGQDLARLPWDFARGVRGPDTDSPRFPFLWVHDLAGMNLPLGVMDVLSRADELPLRVAVTFDPDDELAVRVERKYRSKVGGLSGISVSWATVDVDGIDTRATGKEPKAWQLLEGSAVPVGLDLDAVMDGVRSAGGSGRMLPGSNEAHSDELSKAIREGGLIPGAVGAYVVSTFDDRVVVCAYYDGTLDNASWSIPYSETGEGVTFGEPVEVVISFTATETVKEPTTVAKDAPEGEAATEGDSAEEGRAWPDIAAEMLAVFAPGSPDDDRARRRRYNTLTARYRKLDRTPPEFLTVAEVAALGPDEWRGLWLEGEMADGARVGAVLNSRNVDLLAAARDNITTVLESATAEKDGRTMAGTLMAGAREMDSELAAALAGIAERLDRLTAAIEGEAEEEPEGETPPDGEMAMESADGRSVLNLVAVVEAARGKLGVISNG